MVFPQTGPTTKVSSAASGQQNRTSHHPLPIGFSRQTSSADRRYSSQEEMVPAEITEKASFDQHGRGRFPVLVSPQKHSRPQREGFCE